MLNEPSDDLYELQKGLQASQILYLEHTNHRLYVELIQIIQERQMGWLRPLCFCTPTPQATLAPSSLNNEADKNQRQPHPYLYDMRHSSDLLWPLSDCKIALDIDVIPILSHLGPESTSQVPQDNARKILNQFIKTLWNERIVE